MNEILTVKRLFKISLALVVIGLAVWIYGDWRAGRIKEEVLESPIFGRHDFLKELADTYRLGPSMWGKGPEYSHEARTRFSYVELERLEHHKENLLKELGRYPSREREKTIRAYLEKIEGRIKVLQAAKQGGKLEDHDIFGETIVGSVLVSWPRVIKKGESKVLTVSLRNEAGKYITFEPRIPEKPDPSMAQLESGLLILSPAMRLDGLFTQAGKFWAAKLAAGAFEALPSTPEAQAYGVDKAQWSWTLTPKDGFEGRQIVSLAVEARYREIPEPPMQEESSTRGRRKKGAREQVAATPEPKGEPHDSSYTIHSADLPVDIELGWVDWTKVKVGGLLAILAGAGATIPYLLSKAKSFSEKQKPARKIGF